MPYSRCRLFIKAPGVMQLRRPWLCQVIVIGALPVH